MNRRATKVSFLDEGPHTARCRPKLVVMTGSYLQTPVGRKGNQRAGVNLGERERLFHIDVASSFQAELCNLQVVGRRGGDVDDIRLGFAQQFPQVAEALLDVKPLEQLTRHERLAVADRRNLATLDPLDLRCMVVCNLAASDNRDLKHI